MADIVISNVPADDLALLDARAFVGAVVMIVAGPTHLALASGTEMGVISGLDPHMRNLSPETGISGRDK